MSAYEYKTVALPAVVRGKRRRRQSEADLVAETLGETIQAEAVDGWEYMRAETLQAAPPKGFFSNSSTETTYSVLIFRRARSSAWRAEDAPAGLRRAASRQTVREEERVVLSEPAPDDTSRRKVDRNIPHFEEFVERPARTPLSDTGPSDPNSGDVRALRTPLGAAEDRMSARLRIHENRRIARSGTIFHFRRSGRRAMRSEFEDRKQPVFVCRPRTAHPTLKHPLRKIHPRGHFLRT